MSKKINLSFLTTGGRRSTISMEDPKDDLETDAVTTAMNEVIAADVFEGPDGGSYADIDEAVIVEIIETKLV